MFEARLGPEPDWEKASRQWEGSGQSQREFCRQRGYSYSRFKVARGKLGHCKPKGQKARRTQSRSAEVPITQDVSGFLPLSVEHPAPAVEKSVGGHEAEIEVELPFGVILRFRGMCPR